MRKKYSEFYQPSETKFQELWKESHFVFDASSLLNLYMYSEETANDFIKVLDNIKDKIWISFQAGHEFHYNRPTRIITQQNLFDVTIDTLNSISENAIQSLKSTFINTRDHPSINEKDILKSVSEYFDSLIDNIESKKNNHPNWLLENDEILNNISNLFDGKVGNNFTKEELENIYKEGESRYKNKIPPGFEDAKDKDEIKKYGDLVIWKEILRFATNDDVKSIIFVTDDMKKDWWRIASGRTMGPHPNLIKEFEEYTKKNYYQYNSERFLKFAQDNLVDVREESISETKRVSHNHPYDIPLFIDPEFTKSLKEKLNPLFKLTQEQYDQMKNQSHLFNFINHLNNNRSLFNITQEQLDKIRSQSHIFDLTNDYQEQLDKIKSQNQYFDSAQNIEQMDDSLESSSGYENDSRKLQDDSS